MLQKNWKLKNLMFLYFAGKNFLNRFILKKLCEATHCKTGKQVRPPATIITTRKDEFRKDYKQFTILKNLSKIRNIIILRTL